MSFLADITAFIIGNSTITAALPADLIYTGIQPSGKNPPYAVVIPIGLVPTFTTGQDYFSSFSFQISVYDSDPDNVEAVANIIAGQFDYGAISPSTISCERTNGPVFMVDTDGPKILYHAYSEFVLIENKQKPAT